MNQTERLAKIEVIVENIDKRLEEDRKEQQEYNKAAQDVREEMRRKVSKLTDEQTRLLEWKDMHVDPFIEESTNIRAKVTGGIFVLGLVGGGIWAIFKTFGNKIAHFLGW
jgi:hypothetical protein